tara:strand:+ start:291 stop:1928 length:1638 start_codon:yes stop_codon:yes gene_type:complete
MATYPSDATITTTSFTTVGTTNYSDTGTVREFNLSTTVEHVGEVVATVDGIIQDTSTYVTSNSGNSITFVSAPGASALALKVITLPSRYRTTRIFPQVRYVEYNNTAADIQTINSNAYIINGEIQNFPTPTQTQVNSKNDLLVTLSGVEQTQEAYVFPASNTEPETATGSISRNLGSGGITIGQSADTILLLNFGKNFTDESIKARGAATVSGVTLSSTKKYGNSAAAFNAGTDVVSFTDSNDFAYTGSFSIECFARFEDLGAANTVFSHRTDDNNFVKLSRMANNKIQWTVKESGATVADLQGGSISADTFVHLAITHDRSEAHSRLFVNGTMVQEDNAVNYSITPTGTFDIGRINTTSAATRENLKGFIDSFRFVNETRVYDRTFVAPRTELTRIHTPLQSNDTLVIRHFDSTTETFDRFTSMADRKPDKGFSTSTEFDVVQFTSQGGYEKRTLRSRRSKRDFDISYTNISGVEKHAIEQFYRSRNGSFETFTFDLTHINEIGNIQARFDGSLGITHVFSDASNASLQNNYYTVKFKLKEVYD